MRAGYAPNLASEPHSGINVVVARAVFTYILTITTERFCIPRLTQRARGGQQLTWAEETCHADHARLPIVRKTIPGTG